MKRILIVSTVGLNYEGITSIIYNYTNDMDRNDLKLDFISFENMDLILREKFEKIGKVCFISHRKKDLINYVKELVNLMNTNKYDVVHIHGNSGTMFIEVLLSKICKVKKLIIHCHNTSCSHKVANAILRIPMNILADERLACSKDAGDWLYGNYKYTVLNNAISLERFCYNEDIRNDCRNELGIGNKILVGHVGNFNKQKNHEFLIDIFYKFQKIRPDSALLLLSDGEEFENMKQKVNNMGISKKVFFIGRRADVNRWYQAMDLFLFPSLWEGLGMVLIEAQASGLSCIVSENIPKEAMMTNSIYRIELSKEDKWIEKIEEEVDTINQTSRDELSKMNCKLIAKSGYSIEVEANKLRDLYLKN